MEKSLLTEVKAVLKSLVLSSPDRITIDQLNRDYRDVEGRYIPFRKMGYGNIEEFLRSIPDTLRVFGSGPTAKVCFVANEKSDHIHDMIMKQKKPKTKSARSRSKSLNRGGPRVDNRFNNNSQQASRNPGQHLSPFQSVNRHLATKTIQVRNVPKSLQNNSNAAASLLGQPPVPPLYVLPQPNGIVLGGIPSHLNNINAQRLLVKTIIDNSTRMYEEQVRQVSSLLKSQCHVTASAPPPPLIQCPPGRTVKFTETKSETARAYQPAEIKVDSNLKQVPVKLSHEIESLLSMPKLIKVQNPIRDFKTDDNKLEYPKLFVTKEKESKYSKKVFDISTEKVEDPDEAIPSFAAKNNVFSLDFPKHTVPHGHKIAPFQLSDDIKESSLLKIFITEIHNPFKFWFHIHKDNHELDELMYQIERFYSPLQPDDLCIPIMCLTPGQVCAASYNGLWHRAEIVAPPVNTNVKVSFMDYGTVTEVNVKRIKFLATYFAQLPAQALRGCLSHIKPRAMHWSYEATTYFLGLVEEQMLYAKITEINREENILYMIVCNTNGDEVIQINKSLVNRRYASYNEEWKVQRIKQNNGKRVRHPREDFPTFDMIEKGEYPSFVELVNLQERGIDYEAIYDVVIYNQSTVLNKHENAPEPIRNLPYFLTTSNPFRSDILRELRATAPTVI